MGTIDIRVRALMLYSLLRTHIHPQRMVRVHMRAFVVITIAATKSQQHCRRRRSSTRRRHVAIYGRVHEYTHQTERNCVHAPRFNA